MIQWTHCVGLIRADNFIEDTSVEKWNKMTDGEKKNYLLDKWKLGEVSTYFAPIETSIPCGSDGSSIDFRVDVIDHQYMIYFWGDLRDYEDDEAVIAWINGLGEKIKFIRDGSFYVEVEGQRYRSFFYKGQEEKWIECTVNDVKRGRKKVVQV